MKKLLYSLASIVLINSSVVTATTWKQNPVNFPIKIDNVDANQFGDLHKLVPGTSNRTHWYLRFYITSKMYNVFSLIAQETSRLPIQERQSYFYNLFLGKNSDDYMSWYEEAVKQYQKVIKEYNAIYKIDFGVILENWMKQDYKYFDDVFLAKNLKTNIDKHYFIPPIQTPKEKQRAVEKSWRQNGVVMNIPFFYNSSLPGSNKWKIDKANFRIFPFSYELKPMYYYYSYSKAIVKYNQPPTILLNYEGTSDSARASQIRPLIYNALINSINPPQVLRFPTSCYALLEESTIGKNIYKKSVGHPPTYCTFKMYYYRGSTSLLFSFDFGFYLT